MPKKHLLCLLALFLTGIAFAQESGTYLDDISLDSIDDLFAEESPAEDESSEDQTSEDDQEQPVEKEPSVLESLQTQTGLAVTLSYKFAGGYSPGWSEAPWYWQDEDEEFSGVVGADLVSNFTLDVQLTPRFRVYQRFEVKFPSYDFDIDQFWGEYNLLDTAYFKLGMFEPVWGISPNYAYTNLLNRIPEGSSGGDAYTFRMDIPIGLGGLQLLGLTRSGFAGGDIEDITAGDLGYGIKYNWAGSPLDLNLGVFYHEQMPLRGMASLKTTLFGSTEVYAEGLIAMPFEDYETTVAASGSIGFVDSFFGDKFTVNAEYFYNAEVYTSTEGENDDGSWTEEEISPFIKGHNVALNLYYNLGFANLSFFSKFLYNFNENSGKLAPGFRFRPFQDISVVITTPMAVGDRNGTYYNSNYDTKNRPFSVTLGVILSGSQKIVK